VLQIDGNSARRASEPAHSPAVNDARASAICRGIYFDDGRDLAISGSDNRLLFVQFVHK
jgi:hypothetical protein